HAAERAKRTVDWLHAVDVRDARQAERSQVGQLERHAPREIADGVAAAVAVRVRVRELADADAVEDRENDSGWKDHRKHVTKEGEGYEGSVRPACPDVRRACESSAG